MSRGQTLVVLPTVALRQWQAEILRFTQEGALAIAVYHGTTRGQLTQVMSSCRRQETGARRQERGDRREACTESSAVLSHLPCASPHYATHTLLRTTHRIT